MAGTGSSLGQALLFTMADTDAAPAKAKPAALRKGALVRVNRKAYDSSLEAAVSSRGL